MAVSGIPVLVGLLRVDSRQHTPQQISQEVALLEEVAVTYAQTYDFVVPGDTSAQLFLQLVTALVDWRLVDSSSRSSLQPDHLLCVLQVVRLLSRDAVLRRRFIELGGAKVVTGVLQSYGAAHFAGATTPFLIEILTEAASLAKRLASEPAGLDSLAAAGANGPLVMLLGINDPGLLPLVLVGLLGFAAHRLHYALVAGPQCLETLVRMLATYDLPFKRLAADLLALLARRDVVVVELLQLNALGRLIGQLQSGDAPLTASLLRVICHIATDVPAAVEVRQVGGIPILCSLIAAAARHVTVDLASERTSLPSSVMTEMQLTCTALTRLAEEDEAAYHIRQCGGITSIGKLLLVGPDTSGAVDYEHARNEVVSLKAYAFRALRYLFAVERNRPLFKRLFPPDLFAAFIDIGHYNSALVAYTGLVTRLEELSPKQFSGVAVALDDISSDRDAALRIIHGYVILEMIGKGAFGAVYKARKSKGDSLVALKELPLSDAGIFGATEVERREGLGVMSKEVHILSSLSHPNIVQYYESFVDSQHLYIAMELVEGSSLLDHITSLKEKGRHMPEPDIWQVFLAIVRALNYIHGTKKVVHRDLTPGNIVLGPGTDGLRTAKIADFGLAKRLSASIVAQSVVGTMPYTCPEIIQQEGYTEKADVWSLGCVLYHMMALRPPFDGSNPLSVASKIVEGHVDPIPDQGSTVWSDTLRAMVKAMMTVDPRRRPNIEQVAAYVVGQLVAQMDRMAVAEQRLTRALQVERSHRRAAAVGLGDGTPGRNYSQRKLGSAGALADGSLSPQSPASPPPEPSHSATSPSSTGVATHHAPLMGTANSSTGLNTTSGSRTVTIPQSKLRPLRDPLAPLLQQLHKVMWLDQLPPGLTRDHRRRCVEVFRRHLFGPTSSAAGVKASLAKLVAADLDVVSDQSGRPVDFGSVPVSSGTGSGSGLIGGGDGLNGVLDGGDQSGCLTYEQLHQIIESLLAEKNYYGTSSSVINEHELLESLPAPRFNETYKDS